MSVKTLLRRYFWPNSILAEAEAEAVAIFGSCVCFCLALWELYGWWAGGSLTSAWLTFLFYVVGGCGVRAGSVAAASFVLAWHLLGQIGDLMLGLKNFVLPSVFTFLLILTLRNTWFAVKANRRRSADGQTAERAASDRFYDWAPLLIWKTLRGPFVVAGTAMVALCVIGTVMAIHDPQSARAVEDGKSPVTAPSR